ASRAPRARLADATPRQRLRSPTGQRSGTLPDEPGSRASACVGHAVPMPSNTRAGVTASPVQPTASLPRSAPLPSRSLAVARPSCSPRPLQQLAFTRANVHHAIAAGSAMAVSTARTAAAAAAVMGLVVAAAALLSPAAAAADWDDDEVRALVAIRAALVDPNRVLRDWDVTAGGDPCAWPMVTCNQGHVYQLSLRHQNLSGTLSPAIEKLTLLQNLFLCNNTISGPIPDVIGRMEFLESLDLSNNQFTGSIPSTLGGLTNLQYLDLSFNNLSGTWPIFHERINV
uniref:Leucine-rich repeat-containing N-terminal plant-type domain-containing protein n=1 Tax=Setaria italica TaxID=4555 RepID=K3ZDI4_SETIT